MARPDARRLFAKVPLAVIILSGTVLRFYHLGARALWYDEILVPMAAQHNLKYIFSLCSSLEAHPPLFYLLIKAAMLISSSDAALRVLSTLSGVCAIYVLYRITWEFIDEGTALFTAAFLTLNINHLILSRQVRPYSLHTTLFLIACLFIVRLTKEGRWRDLVWLCSVNFMLFWLHYLTFHLAIAQGLILTFFWIYKSSPFTFKQFITFCIITVLTAFPLYIWFVLPSLAHQLSSSHLPRPIVWRYIAHALRFSSSFIYLNPLSDSGMYILVLVGCMGFLLRRPKLGASCLFTGVVPLVIILVMAPGYPLRTWHTLWITPLFSLCAAMALSWLPGCKVTAPLLAAGGALFILIHQHALYYEPASGLMPSANYEKAGISGFRETNETDFKETAARLRPLLSFDAANVGIASLGLVDAISWYLDKSPPNPFRMQHLELSNTPITLNFISGSAFEGQYDIGESYIRGLMGDLGKVTQVRDATVYTFQVNRHPITNIDKLPLDVVFPSNPREFYSTVSRIDSVRGTVVPTKQVNNELYVLSGITATQNDHLSSYEFIFKNNISDKAMQFFIKLHYINIGFGNWIGIFANFDDEPTIPLVTNSGLGINRTLQKDFFRSKPFKQLTLIVRMYCTDDTPTYFGDNLNTLISQGLRVMIFEAGDQIPREPAKDAAIQKNGN